MKAIIYNKYGPPEVLKLQHIPTPIPGDKDVLIRNLATTVTARDWRFRKAWPFLARFYTGLLKPSIPVLGSDFAGEIVAIGREVSSFKRGDLVFGSTDHSLGAYAQFVCMPQTGLIVKKPDQISIKEAAAVFFGGHSALHFLRQGGIKKGHKVLIYGASGCVGSFAVQLSKYFGAKVTGVCSGKNLTLIKSLGADRVLDYTREDFSIKGEIYDIIFDTVGKSPYRDCMKTLKNDGVFLSTVLMTPKAMLNAMWTRLTTKKKVIGGSAEERIEDLEFLSGLLQTGDIKPVIDREFPLEQIIEAHRYVEKGHKTGNVVITISHKA